MTKKPPAVSVILPVFNAVTTLAQAVESLLWQTLSDFEIIIVDDGSTDGTTDLIRRLAQADQRVRPIFASHQGIVAALNTGLAEARAPLIARMDADDICLPSRLKNQKDFLGLHPEIGLVSCRIGFLGDQAISGGYSEYVRWLNTLLSPQSISVNRFVESPLAHPSVMFRTALIQQFGGYRDGPFPEDYDLWLRWLGLGVAMAKLDKQLFLWRDTPNRLSRTHDRYSDQAFARLKAEHLALWLSQNNPHHPDIMAWGAGRITRQRLRPLTELGIRVQAYVDIDPHKIGNRIEGIPVIRPEALPSPGSCFVLASVASRGARDLIAAKLESLGFTMGKNYILGA